MLIICGIMLSCSGYAGKPNYASQENLDTEISDRIAADNDLQSKINVLKGLPPAGQSCTFGSAVTGFDADGNIICEFICSVSMPFSTLFLVCNGSSVINVITELDQEINNINPGDFVSITTLNAGHDFSIKISGDDFIGSSEFHISCSDDDMNGPEDCGKLQGDGKGNDSSRINEWLLEGMEGDNGSGFHCTILPRI